MQTVLLEEHTEGIKALAWSPDSKVFVSASDDSTVRMWSRNGKHLKLLEGNQSEVYMIEWTPDGKGFATVEKGMGSGRNIPGTIGLWDKNGGLIKRFETSFVRAMAWSPDGTHLATGSIDKKIRLWSRTGKLVRTLEGHKGAIYSVAWSSENGQLASAGSGGEIFLWEENWNYIELSGVKELGEVTRLKWSPDGALLASFGGGEIHFWDHDGKRVKALTFEDRRGIYAHTEDIVDLVWAPDGRLLASASWDCKILFWDRTGECLKMIKVPDNRSETQYFLVPRSISFTRDGQIIASTYNDGSIRFWNTEAECIGTGKLNLIRKDVRAGTILSIMRTEDAGDYDDKALWSPDGKFIAVWEKKNSSIVLFEWITSTVSELIPEASREEEVLDKEIKCPICYQLIQQAEDASQCHYCGTLYHMYCILMWILQEKSKICPNCENIFIQVI